MSPIKKCVALSALKFDTVAVSHLVTLKSNLCQISETNKPITYTEDGAMHWQFMVEMMGFTSLLASGANTIITLEDHNTTCADVFYAWVCMFL